MSEPSVYEMSNENASETSTNAVSRKARIRSFFSACPPVCVLLFVFGLIAFATHMTSIAFPEFADFVTRHVGVTVRLVLAKLTGWIPFSLAELILICLPLILGLLIYGGIKAARSLKKYAYPRYLCTLLAIIMTFYSLFVFTLGTGYQGTTLYEKLELEKPDYEDPSDLLALARYLRDRANECAEDVCFDGENGSIMPYSRKELNDLLNEACIKASKKYKFISPLKSNFKDVTLSPLMTYTHISGVYSYYTGEANINTNFPDYTLPYTAAHEMAHQRGIAREDEANFVAYLICMESDDNYIRYSAYTNLLEYVQSSLRKADKSVYKDFYRTLGTKIMSEQIAYSNFFDKYRVNVAADVSGAVNNAYLQSQGQSAGTMSYNLVVGLAIAYIDY